MSKNRVILSLLPGRLDVVAYEGKRQCLAERLSMPNDGDTTEWLKAIRQAVGPLLAIVEKANLTGAATTLLYRSPTQSVDLVGLPIRDKSQAIEAARLSLLNSLSYSAVTAVCQASVIGRDAGEETRKTHIMVVAEREDIAQALVDLTENAGLKFHIATPHATPIKSNLAAQVLHNKAINQGVLYVGEHSSYFAVGSQRTLLFFRRINLGFELLANALTRPLRLPGHADLIELDIETARDIIARHGISYEDKPVHESPKITGKQTLPLLQPVIQRCIVELRQSLRFGLQEQHRENLNILVTGLGSSIPGLDKMIAEELGVDTTRDEKYGSYQHNKPGSDGSELVDALKDPGLLEEVNMLPHDLARRRRTSRLTQWLWTGAIAAVCSHCLRWVSIQREAYRPPQRSTDVRITCRGLQSSRTNR